MDSTKQSTRTCAEAKAWLDDFGVPVVEWAKIHGFPKEIVYSVLSGRNRGTRGQAYDVAVALGIRPSPPSNIKSPRDVASIGERHISDSAGSENVSAGKESTMSP